MPEQFYILSLKVSNNDELYWYRPNSHGYTRYLSQAGKYGAEEAKANTMEGVTMAVPVEEADTYAQLVVRPELFIRDNGITFKQTGA